MADLTAAELRAWRPPKSLRGYTRVDVDAFIARAVHALEILDRGRVPTLSDADVERTVFSQSLRGYDLDRVDEMLDRIAARLAKPARSWTLPELWSVVGAYVGDLGDDDRAAVERFLRWLPEH